MATNNITFPIYNADGTPFNGLVLRNAAFDSVVMSLGDKITGDVYYRDNTLAVTMSEYIEYKRNEDSEAVRFVLVNPPTVVREGIVSDNSELHGMTKYSFVFYHPMCQVGNFPFTDVAVSSNEEKFRSDNKTFVWSGNLFNMVAKLNKNLQGTQWIVDTNIEHYEQDGVTETSMWQKAAKIPDEPLSFDKTYVSEVLKTSYETWEIPFIVDQIAPTDALYAQGKRFLILFGTPSNEILDDQDEPYIFRFGQGVGLKNNSRTPKNNKIVTRIVGYGSESNIPFGYPQIQWFGDQTWKYTVNNDLSAEGSLPIYKGILGGKYVNLIKHPFTRKTLMPSVYRETLFNKVSPYMPREINPYEQEGKSLQEFYEYIDYVISTTTSDIVASAYTELKETVRSVVADDEYKTISFGNAQTDQYEGSVTLYSKGNYKTIKGDVEADDDTYTSYTFDNVFVESFGITPNPDFDPTIELVDYYDADGSYVNPVVEGAESVEIHQFDDIKPEFTEHSIVDAFAYDSEHEEAISYAEFIERMNGLIVNATNENEKVQLTLYRDSVDAGMLYSDEGDEGGSYTWHRNLNIVDEYYMRVRYTSDSANFNWLVVRKNVVVPATQWDDTMDDDGNYKQSYFKITLPQLDFDLYACASITEEMKINMRSGACIGCTFDIAVDWDDYKKNFYDSDGNFLPDGEQRNLTKYPKTNLGQVTFVAKKDLDTFGTLMPNTYQQPHSGDEFVILGISLPTTYVTNAEARLDDAAKEYMRENNVHYYEYPLKFDEHFLATHTNILSQIRNNTIVRFQYGGELPMALYVKQMTIKYSGVLPTYDITLTDDVEIVLNQIGQVTDDVSRMRVQVSELQKYYSENIIQAINEKLSKVVDDVCQGRITFQQGLDSIGSAIFHDELRSPDFTSGLYTGRGWRVDQLGNAEFESVRARSFLEVVELLVNRMQAQEGDTVFSDNDQIDRVDRYVDPTDSSVSYVLSLKEKWAGYYTPQMYGNILKGVINTLAAKDAGVSDVQDSQTVEKDGSNSFFTSWMRVIATHNTDNTLSPNQIRVVLYGDNEVPAQKNFEPCELMTMTRWGCINYSAADASKYADEGLDTQAAILASIKRRQQVFYISTSEGRIVKLTGVDSPILRNGNFGTTLGILPEFVQNYPVVHDRMIAGRDYLYAQGVVVGDFIKIDVDGNPIPTVVDKGEWQNNTPYYYNKFNETTQQYETHRVRHNGGTWQCLQSQPVIESGVAHYYPPKWNSPYWMLVDGNDNLTIEFVSTNGSAFYQGYVNTVITPHLFYGNVEIDADGTEIAAQYWSWTRETESGKTDADRNWDSRHTGVKVLNLANGDMPTAWGRGNKAIFTCTVVINDGKSDIIVQNQVIA